MSEKKQLKEFIQLLNKKENIDLDGFKKGVELVDADKDLFVALLDYLYYCIKSTPDDVKKASLATKKIYRVVANEGKDEWVFRYSEKIIKCLEGLSIETELLAKSADKKWNDSVKKDLIETLTRGFESDYRDESKIDRKIYMTAFKSLLELLMNFPNKPNMKSFWDDLRSLLVKMQEAHPSFGLELSAIAIDSMKVFVFNPTWKKDKYEADVFESLSKIVSKTLDDYVTKDPEEDAKFFDNIMDKVFKIIMEAMEKPKTCNMDFLYKIQSVTVYDMHRKYAPRVLKNWDKIFKIWTFIPESNLITNKAWVQIFDDTDRSFDQLFSKEGKEQFQESSDELEKIEKIWDSFFDFIYQSAAKKLKNTQNVDVMSRMIQERLEESSDFSKIHHPRAIKFLKDFPKELSSIDGWNYVARRYLEPIHEDSTILKKPSKDVIEMVLQLFNFPDLEGYAHRMADSISSNNVRAFAPYADKLIEGMRSSIALRMLPDVYKFNPEPFHKSTEKMLEAWEDMEPNDKGHLVSFLWTISKMKPECLSCFIRCQSFKDALFVSSTCAMIPLILKEYLKADVVDLVDWIDDLKMFVQTNTMSAYSVGELFGILGRADSKNRARILSIMDELMKVHQHDNVAVMGWMMGMKNIQEQYPETVSQYIPYIKKVQEKTMDSSVRSIAQLLIDKEEHTDLKSVNQKVDNVEVKIENVEEQVKEQNVKIEVMEVKVAENTEIVTQVKIEVEETKKIVEEVQTKVEVIEVKVEQQEEKIQKILDQFDIMNAKVSESCKNFDELKEYVDKNISMVKDFVAEVVKKLPNPYKFTSQGKIRRKLLLYFECCKNTKVCMFNRESPFTTQTSDWAKWLKIGFSLFKLSKCLYDKDIFGTVDTVKDIYNDFKSKEDENFMSYISQPFLTGAEQDSLIEQLRDERFFDLFEYDAQNASWCCTKCARRAEEPESDPEPEIKSETIPEVVAVKQEDVANELVEDKITQEIEKKTQEIEIVEETEKKEKKKKKKDLEESDSAPSPKLESHMKVSVGFFKRITKVWCVLDETKIIMYDKQTSPKPKHQVTKRDIVDIKDIDPRVSKVEHSFKIITKNRTYTACAPDGDTLNSWKKALSNKK